MELLLFTVVFVLLLPSAYGYGTGGPAGVCHDPYPHHHGHPRSLEASPFAMSLDKTQYNPGDTVKVTISSSGSSELFRGLQVGAHAVDGIWETLYGEFTKVPAGVQGFKYFSDVENCVTHNKNFSKTGKVELEWKAPNVSVGNIMFSATVLKDYETYWVNLTGDLTAALPLVASAVDPPISVGSGGFDKDLDIAECGKTSGCITYPKDCTAATCDFAVSYKTVTDGIRFRLTNKRAIATASYSALGISTDQFMPKDETITCMDIGGSLDLAHGYNPGMYNTKIKSRNQISDILIQSVDGTLSCEFIRKLKVTVETMGYKGVETLEFDYTKGVDNPEYFLYLSFGDPYPGAKESVEKHHELPIVSQSKVAFGKMERTHFYTLHDSVKVHVMFMVVSWFGAAAVAAIVSRYYKDGFLNSTDMSCGVKPWFQVHRSLAFITTILSVVAFIIIFVRYDGWTDSQSLHAGFGIAVMVLTILQVIAGMLRPGPDDVKKRALFNWIHRVSGVLTYILAAATMFIGTRIPYMTERMKTTGTGLLAGLVVVQIVTAVILEIFSASTGKASHDDTNGNAGDSTMKIEDTKKQPSTARHTRSMALFVFYVCTLVSLLICFLALLWID